MSIERFYGLIELLLVFGAVMAWALWQWWGLRRWRKQQKLVAPQDEPKDDSSR